MAVKAGRPALSLLLAFGLWGLGVWPATAWLGYDLIHTEIEGMRGLYTSPSTLLGRDFVNLWHGGQEAAASGGDVVYDRAAYREALKEKVGFAGIYTFSYPPHMLMLALPLGALPYLAAYALWQLGGLGLFWHAARPWLRDAGLPGWAALLLPAPLVNLWAAHFGFFIGALALHGWRLAERAPARAGLAFALMTVKPHIGILTPLVLALKGQWRTLATAALGAAALVLASIALFGAGPWRTWLASTLAFQASLVEPVARSQYSFMMPTVGRMALAVTQSPSVVIIIQIGFALAALVLLFWAAARRATLTDLGLLSLAATTLILPYSFNYDMVALSLAALLWAARSPAAWWSPERLVYAAAFIAPLTQHPLALEGWWPTPIAILAAMTFAAWRAGKHR